MSLIAQIKKLIEKENSIYLKIRIILKVKEVEAYKIIYKTKIVWVI